MMAPAVLAKDYLVTSQKEYRSAHKKLKPGDNIILKDGEWNDFQMIALRAETPGGVKITGRSNLRIGGAYLAVSGLVFKNGYSTTRELIDMREAINIRAQLF